MVYGVFRMNFIAWFEVLLMSATRGRLCHHSTRRNVCCLSVQIYAARGHEPLPLRLSHTPDKNLYMLCLTEGKIRLKNIRPAA